MVVNFEQMQLWINYFKELGCSPNYILLSINTSLIILIVILKEKIVSIKGAKDFDYLEVIFEIILGVLIGGIIVLIFNKMEAVFFSASLSPFVAEFIFNKYNSKVVSSKVGSENHNVVNINMEGKTIDDEVKDLSEFKNKYDPNNIIDILTVYNYIGANHRRKLYESAIFAPDPEDAVKELLDMKVLTEEELSEAYAIKNLIKLKGRMVTRDEALMWIIKCQNTNKM